MYSMQPTIFCPFQPSHFGVSPILVHDNLLEWAREGAPNVVVQKKVAAKCIQWSRKAFGWPSSRLDSTTILSLGVGPRELEWLLQGKE